MKYKGHLSIGIKTKQGKYPSDLTANEEIKQFLESFSAVTSPTRSLPVSPNLSKRFGSTFNLSPTESTFTTYVTNYK